MLLKTRMKLLLSVLMASAIPVFGETYEDWEYSVFNEEVTITKYIGAASEITIPDSLGGYPVRKIRGSWGTGVFGDSVNPSQATTINMPSTLKEIGDWSLFNCPNLTSLNIPEGVEKLGFASIQLTGLHNLSIPNSVTLIEPYALAANFSLGNLVLPPNLTQIKQGVLSSCHSLTNVVIPASVTSIDYVAFESCSSLSTILIPASVTNLGSMVFSWCSNLGAVIFEGDAPIVGQENWVDCPATVFRSEGTTGWGSSFSGRPVKSLSHNLIPSLGEIIKYLKNNPVFGLYNQSEYDANRNNGQSDILNNPNASGLFTTNQIHNLGLGGIVLNRDTNNQFTLNYQILQSTDLQNWTPYQNVSLPITNAPSDKVFLRVQAVGQ